MRIVFLLAVCGCLAAREPSRLGASLQWAVPFSGIFQDIGGRESASDRSPVWSVGPALHWGPSGRIYVSLSALYRQAGRDAGGGYFGSSIRERGYSWEIPLLARWRISPRGPRPFLTAGPAALLVHTHSDADYFVGPASTDRVQYRTTDSDAIGGIVAGGGIEHRFGGAALTIEVRYTRWLNSSCYPPDLRCFSSNRGAAIFGIGF